MLPPKNRVRSEFFAKREKLLFVIDSPYALIRAYKSVGSEFNVGVIIPKKVERKAVSRNSIKRQIYRIFENHKSKLFPHTYIVSVKKKINDNLWFVELEEELKKFLDKTPDVV